ncbi:hypothetical protein [Lacinutrix sp. MEBiC02404]
MKNILKTSIKIIVLFFALTLVNCEKDDEFKENTSQNENTNKVLVKRVTLNEIKENSELNNTFYKINKYLDVSKINTVNSKINASDGSFVILTDEIVQTVTDNSEAYTFKIETPIHSEATFNY